MANRVISYRMSTDTVRHFICSKIIDMYWTIIVPNNYFSTIFWKFHREYPERVFIVITEFQTLVNFLQKKKHSKNGLHAHHLHFMSTAWPHEHAVIVSEYRTYSNISIRFPSSILHIHNVNNRRQTGIGLWRIEWLEWKMNKKAYKRAWNNQNTTWLVSKQLHKKPQKVHLKE